MKRITLLLLAITFIFTLSTSAIAELAPPDLTYSIDGVHLSVSWSPVTDATGYTFYYAPSPYAGTETISNLNMGSQTSLDADLWYGASYLVGVQAQNPQENSAFSNIEEITIPYPSAPEAPELTYSVDGTNLSMSWEAVPDATGYYLHYVLGAYTTREALLSNSLGNNTSFSYSGLVEGQTYTIALTSYSEHGESELSNIETFMVPETVTVELSGIIRENLTFSNGEQVVLTANIQIAEGFTLRLKNDTSLIGNHHTIEIFGDLVVSGSQSDLIEITNTSFEGRGGMLVLAYGDVKGGGIPSFDSNGSLIVRDSVVSDTGSGFNPSKSAIVSGNILSGVSIRTSQNLPTVIRNNTFISNSTIDTVSWHDTFIDSHLVVEGNNFLGSGVVLSLNPFFDDPHDVRTSGNYWGSHNIAEIDEKITDGNDDLNINGIVDISNRASGLTSAAPMALGKYVVDSSTWLLSQ